MKNAPKLRFKEFNYYYIKTNLKEICEINPKGDLPESFNYISLESVTDGMLLSYTEESIDTAPSRAQRKIEKYDILYQTVRPYQKNNLLFKIDNSEDFVASTGYAQLRAKRNISPEYLYQNLLTEKFTNEVINRCTGTSFPAINVNDLSTIDLFLPRFEEQEKIAKFLSKVDEKISLLERKIDNLDKYKFGVSQLIFKQLNGKNIPLNKLCDIVKGQQVNGSDLKNSGKFYMLNGGVSPSGYLDEWNTEKNTTSISEGGNSCGYVHYNKSKFWSGGHCYTLQNVRNIDNKYLYQFLKYNERNIMNLRVGSGLPNIQKKDLEKLQIIVPESSKQSNIVKILDSLDLKIQIEKERLATLKKYKEGLLQQMFV